MYLADLFIICAGKGSRMGGNVPKALVPITNEPNLTTTLKQIGDKFDQVFIVTNEDIQDQWTNWFETTDPYLLDNVVNVPISSGLGDGHAVFEALTQRQSRQDITIAWGDVFFQHAEIVDELYARELSTGLVPAVHEEDPYVSLLTDHHLNIMSADFSKYGEHHPTGFHDQSIFRFRRRELIKCLGALHSAFWKNGRYITPGGELSLLYAFHHMYNNGVPAKLFDTEYPTLSFNTPEEVVTIQQEINNKWSKRQS